LLDSKEDILDPVLKFMSGAPKTIYDDAKRFLEEQHANFSDLEGDESLKAKEILGDPRCFAGKNMQQLKYMVESLRAKIETLLSEVRRQAQEVAESMQRELAEMDDFHTISEPQRQELLLPFATFATRIQQQKVAAVIRETARQFNGNEFIEILNKQSRWVAAAKKAANDAVNAGKDKGGDGGINNPYPKPGNDNLGTSAGTTREREYISKNDISIHCKIKTLANEDDLNSYVQSIKEAYLAEIKQGKIVRL
jgi:hypothetical protein